MSGESVPTTANGQFDPASKTFGTAKAKSLQVRKSIRHSLAEALELKDLLYNHIQDLREKFSCLPPTTTRGEARLDSAALTTAVRTWEIVQARIERIRTQKSKK